MKHLVTSLASIAALITINVGLAYAAADTGGTAVPLPGSLALLVTGAIGLAAAGWWTRKK